jgi:L-ribulose-5-phosphate 3-epimerase
MEQQSNPTSDIARRTFLKVTGAALAGHSLIQNQPLSAKDEKQSHNNKRFKKAVKLSMVRGNMSVTEKFQLVKSLGFDGIEVKTSKKLLVDEVIEAKEKTGLPIHGILNSEHWKMPISHADNKIFSYIIHSLESSLRDAKACGATSVLLVPGVVNKNTSYGKAYHRVQEGIRKLLPLANELGIQILLENVWNNFLLSPVELARFIDELESDLVGSYFDVGNVVRFGWPEHWILALGHRIKKLDIKEYSKKLQNTKGPRAGFKCKLGEGTCDWPAIVKALKEIGYTGWATAEVAGGGKEHLQDVADRMDKILEINS